MGKKIKILVACPAPDDATSYYRGLGPLTELCKQYEEVEITQGGMNSNDYSWPKLKAHDVLFFQRPTLQAHLNIIQEALHRKLPVWIDYDDDLLSVPKENPTFALYNSNEARNAVIGALQRATLVSVSTEHLKRRFQAYNKSIQVIPNALDGHDLLPRRKLVPMNERRKIVLWRGSSTHVGDLLHFKDEILKVYHANPGWQWFFLGWEPWYLTQEMKPEHIGIAPWKGHTDYFNLIQTIQAPISIVPLPDSEFNKSKSNIAWIESTLAGSACLCPDFEAWDYEGPIKYFNTASFGHRLTEMMTGQIDLHAAQEKSWETIESKLLLQNVNKLRRVALERVLQTKYITEYVAEKTQSHSVKTDTPRVEQSSVL